MQFTSHLIQEIFYSTFKVAKTNFSLIWRKGAIQESNNSQSFPRDFLMNELLALPQTEILNTSIWRFYILAQRVDQNFVGILI